MIKKVKIPKILMEHEYYKNLSDRAKVLYGILSEKMQEAERYGWVDEEGNPYVVFPKKQMQKELACSRYRLDIVTKELIVTDLIEFSYDIGSSLERRIYVHNLSDSCPWIRVEYGIRNAGRNNRGTGDPAGGAPVTKDARGSVNRKGQAEASEPVKEGEGSGDKCFGPGTASGGCEYLELLGILKLLAESEKTAEAPGVSGGQDLAHVLCGLIS